MDIFFDEFVCLLCVLGFFISLSHFISWLRLKEERDQADVLAHGFELLLEAASCDITKELAKPRAKVTHLVDRGHQRRHQRSHVVRAEPEAEVYLQTAIQIYQSPNRK